jgi:hypothetical protein
MKSQRRHQHVTDGQIFHLVTKESRGRPLCGESSPSALIGSYVEHLDTSGDEVRWVREVFGPNGKPVNACWRCFYTYPYEIKQITPFSVVVTAQFEPNKMFCGYDCNASAIAQIGDQYERVKVYSDLGFKSAQWFDIWKFGMHVDATAIVPWIHKANKS